MLYENPQFHQLYVEHYQRVHLYLTRFVGNEDADDLAQEVFIKVANSLNSFNNQSSVTTWIYRIATNTAMDRLKSRAHKQDQATIYCENLIQYENPNQANLTKSTEDTIVRKEMNDCIRTYVSFLPENYRAVLVLSEMEGFKNREIATILGLSINTVKIRLHRAKEKLKQELTTHCTFYRTDCNQLACEPKKQIKKCKPFSQQKADLM